VERIACIIDSCVPTHSSVESAPRPFVSSWMRDALVAALADDERRKEQTRARRRKRRK
jgi:hypothetical protein